MTREIESCALVDDSNSVYVNPIDWNLFQRKNKKPIFGLLSRLRCRAWWRDHLVVDRFVRFVAPIPYRDTHKRWDTYESNRIEWKVLVNVDRAVRRDRRSNPPRQHPNLIINYYFFSKQYQRLFYEPSSPMQVATSTFNVPLKNSINHHCTQNIKSKIFTCTKSSDDCSLFALW